MKKILLVEDDDSLYSMYEPEFKLRGYDLIRGKDVAEGIKLIKSEKPDLVLMDIVLPDKTGIVALEEIKNDPTISSVPVIMLTNFGNEENVEKALNLGAEDFILKYKIVPSEVVDKIKSYLESKGKGEVTLTD